MISFLKGKIVTKSATTAEIECGGIGYSILISLNTSQRLPNPGNDATILTILIPREDSLTLYGFIDNSERDAFRLLISVNGVGPKTALAVLSSVNVNEFVSNITIGNISGLQKLPGIGRKTAERIILELKDKVVAISNIGSGSTDGIAYNINIKEAILALISLGYNHQQAEKYINSAVQSFASNDEQIITTESLLKIALQNANK